MGTAGTGASRRGSLLDTTRRSARCSVRV